MYVLRFFFDYSGTCLWSANDQARERFGYPVELADLPIPYELRVALSEACDRFDTSLDWGNPGGSSTWSEEDAKAFRQMSDELLSRLREALGPSFQIRDER